MAWQGRHLLRRRSHLLRRRCHTLRRRSHLLWRKSLDVFDDVKATLLPARPLADGDEFLHV